MGPAKRFVYHCAGIFFYYRFVDESPYHNEHTKSMNIWRDGWFVGVQLRTGNDKWFDYEDLYYDGMTAKILTILGIRFIKGYDYEWEDLGKKDD